LNDSTKALSVGLPGRLKSSVTSFSYAQRSSPSRVKASTTVPDHPNPKSERQY